MLAYIVVVLTARQVELATDEVSQKGAFQSASYGFAVFSILAPLVAVVLLLVAFLTTFVKNWVVAKLYEDKRFNTMGLLDPNTIL